MSEGTREFEESEPVRAVVDRIEGDLAVLLIGDDELERHLSAADLPEGVGEGTVVLVRQAPDGWQVIEVDADAEAARRERTQHLLDRIRSRRRGGRFGRGR